MAKPTPKSNQIGSILFLIGCIITGAILGFWIVRPKEPKPYWQTYLDESLSTRKTEEQIELFVKDIYSGTLISTASEYMKHPDGSKSNAFDKYKYISEKTGYECTQIGEYDDSINSDLSFIECHKK